MSENDSLKKKRQNKKKKNKKKKIILVSILSVLAIIIAVVWGYFNHNRNKIYVEYKPERKNPARYKEVDGITNVLLIGTDGR
ncbi:transcriptional regulator, partial [Clostridium perfringens]|nr:transcriptional regulator [Clostridium perfringens]